MNERAVISRDIVTGEEVLYDSTQSVANALALTEGTFKRTFLDKPRQLFGRHWRYEGNPFWRPPSGFVFDNTSYVKNRYMYITATNYMHNTSVYENATEASKILFTLPQNIQRAVSRVGLFGGYRWDLLYGDGSWSNQGPLAEDYVAPKVPHSHGFTELENHMTFIARDLVTGDETIFHTMKAVRKQFSITTLAMIELLNSPRHAFGKQWRTIHAHRYWTPPALFRYNPRIIAKHWGGYILATDANGNKTVYETAAEAHRIDGIPVSRIKKSIAEKRPIKGVTWTTISEWDDLTCIWAECEAIAHHDFG
jgi:hypothetical protein